ncbi:MAG: hypothetical protein BA874_10755 [Desulfuromonadales bacterium C00003068]|jgi:diguanylate cyclase (GGDEF)-like protein|nr:MAG: hypothetical protein BA874_10755 [Desulfuromonadales bacterium C00003068]
MKKWDVRKKIMFLIFIQVVILLHGLGYLYLHEHLQRHKNTLANVTTSLKKTIEREAQETQERYSSRVKGFVKTNNKVITAFAQQDLNALQLALKDKIKTLEKEDCFFYSISFINADGTVFLRSAKPKSPPDNVSDVPFALDCITERIPMGGLTLARGGLAHRFSHPVYANQEYIGTIVLVVKPLRALVQAKEMYEVDSGIFVFNDNLSTEQKENRNSFSNMTLMASIGSSFNEAQLSEKLLLAASGEQLSHLDQHYIKYPPVSIFNYLGKQIGFIVSVKEMTTQHYNIVQTVTRGAILSTIIIIIAMCVLYFGLGVILQRVNRLHAELEQRVEQRTVELSRVNNQLEQEILERIEAQQSLQLLCQQDGVTGISNRRHFDSILELEWNAAIREKRKLSVLMIDIDSFKNYNDNYGHIEGDHCLRTVSKALEHHLRRSRDLVARFGGEEFVCLLPETELCDAQTMANKLRAEIEGLAIPHLYSDTAKVVTISIGVCCMTPQIDEIYQLILSRADEAMYIAKNKGRNQVQCYKS